MKAVTSGLYVNHFIYTSSSLNKFYGLLASSERLIALSNYIHNVETDMSDGVEVPAFRYSIGSRV